MTLMTGLVVEISLVGWEGTPRLRGTDDVLVAPREPRVEIDCPKDRELDNREELNVLEGSPARLLD